MQFEVFGNAVRHCLECFIVLIEAKTRENGKLKT